MSDGGEMESSPMSELSGEGTGERLVAEAVLVVKIAEELEGLAAGVPLAVAAIFPLGEVAWGDGATVKLGLENGLHFREGVEPREDRFGLVAVVEAGVELFADLVREASNFSDAGHKNWMVD